MSYAIPGTAITRIARNRPAKGSANALRRRVSRDQFSTAADASIVFVPTAILYPVIIGIVLVAPTYQPSDHRAIRRLLDEAGYPDPDGPGGAPRMRLSYKTSSNQFRLGVARVIAAQLRDIGIDVEVHSFEFGTFFADIKAGNYQLGSMQTSAITEPDFYYTYFHSSRVPTDASPHLHNRWRYRSEDIDSLTDKARHSMEREERAALAGGSACSGPRGGGTGAAITTTSQTASPGPSPRHSVSDDAVRTVTPRA